MKVGMSFNLPIRPNISFRGFRYRGENNPDGWEINLAEEKRTEQTGYVIATKRLTDEQWQNFKFGELIVFKDGKMIYSNCRDVSKNLETAFTEVEKEILKIQRINPHRLSLKEIARNLTHSKKEIKSAIRSLLCKEYIRQDRRDNVKWDHEDATFYTEPSKRKKINGFIK